jgi:hypothetical protein
MKLMLALAIALKDDEHLKGTWPPEADDVQQTSNWYVTFNEECQFDFGFSQELEMDDLPFMEEYDEDGDIITRAEFEAFIAADPDWYNTMMTKRPVIVDRIAELNGQVAALINEMGELAEEAGIELEIDLGNYGGLNPNSDWDSSRC